LQGVDINARNEFDATALMEVAELGNVPMVKLLLELGADPNLVSSGAASSALFCAITTGKVELIEALLNAGASPAHEGGHSLGLALMLCPLAAQPTIRALLEKAEAAG
jgi:ankyrin repeat protein